MDPAPPSLVEAEACYRRGDFPKARRIAKAVAASADGSADARERARKILAATGVDPIAIAAFSVTALLLAFLIARYVL